MVQLPPDAAAGTPPLIAPTHQMIINAQYLKDFSFESPRAPQILMTAREAPAVSLNVDVKARSLGPEVYEVVLNIGAQARQGDDPVFLVELAYAAVVTLRQVTPEVTPFLVFVEAPRVMFPFARAIVANATRDGGFPPLLINPIDFLELFRRERDRAINDQNGQGAQPPTATA